VTLVLFDIDGTILNSHGAGRHAVEKALTTVCGIPVSPDGIEFAGRTDPQIMWDMLSGAGLSPDRIESVFELCLSSYTSVLMTSMTPARVDLCPGADDLIRRIADQTHLSLGLLTGNLRETAYLKLQAAGLSSFFSIGAFGSDSPDRRDLPEIAVERARSVFGQEFGPSDTVILGDTPSDIDCAHFFGARSIAVATGVFSAADLAECSPDLLVHDLSDTHEILNFISLQ
jgi:phosphoglycolate phosphatase